MSDPTIPLAIGALAATLISQEDHTTPGQHSIAGVAPILALVRRMVRSRCITSCFPTLERGSKQAKHAFRNVQKVSPPMRMWEAFARRRSVNVALIVRF